MSEPTDPIILQVQVDSLAAIKELTAAVEQLHKGFDGLGLSRGPDDLSKQFKDMQTQVTMGFKSIEMQLGDFDTKIRQKRKTESEKLLAQEKADADRKLKLQQETYDKYEAALAAQGDRIVVMSNKFWAKQEADTLAHEARQLASANKFHDAQLESEIAAENARASVLKKRIEFEDTLGHQRLQAEIATNEKLLEADIASENARANALKKRIELQDTIQLKRVSEEIATNEKILEADIAAENQRAALLRKRIEFEDTLNHKRLQDSLATKAKEVEAAQLQEMELYHIREAGLEKQRVLNTNFLTSSLAQQIAAAEKAAVYSNMGGNATQKFGSSAATADIAALRAQYASLPEQVKKSQDAIEHHNAAMNEAHAFARGLSGSLGGLWLTYGSLIPIAAGAAIAGSLRQIVEVGKDVEYQLQFVAALSKEAVPIEDFLHITAGTVASVKEAAEGMRALAQNGLSVKDSLSVLPEVLNLAVIGEMGVEAAALAATGALSAFNLQVTEVGRVGDILAKTAAASNTSVAALTESLKQASTVASMYHVSIEEVAAGLGTLAKINITGSAAGTAYRSMLDSLYTPTAGAAKALKILKVDTQEANGELRNSTAVLLDLRNALSQYSESAQAGFLSDIGTKKATKGMATILANLDDYSKKLKESQDATGFMSDAVIKLEDTSEGAFRRLRNSASATFVHAFSDASPALQSLVDQLAAVARSEGAVRLLSGLAVTAIGVTKALVDNVASIGMMVAAYAAMAGIPALWGSLTAAVAVYNRGIIAAESLTAVFGVTARAALGVLGPLGLAIGAATLAWSLYNYETDKTANNDTRIKNSTENRIEMLHNETEALDKRNAALQEEIEKRNKLTLGTTYRAPAGEISTVQDARDRAQELRLAYDAAQSRLQVKQDSDTSTAMMVAHVEGLRKQYEAAQEIYDKLDKLEKHRTESMSTQKSATSLKALMDQLEELAHRGDTLTTKEGLIVPVTDGITTAAQEKAKSALGILEKLASKTYTYEQALAAYNVTRREYNDLLKPAPAKTDMQELGVDKEKLETLKRIAELQRTTEAFKLKSDHNAGRVGEIDFLKQTLALEKDKQAQLYLTAMEEAKLLDGVEKKRAAQQKAYGVAEGAKAKSRELEQQYLIAEQSYTDGLIKKNLESDAEMYAKKGDLQQAYLAKFQATYGKEIAGIEADLAKLNLEDAGKAFMLDLQDVAKLSAYNAKLAETVRLRHLLEQRDSGEKTAVFDMNKSGFDAALTQVQEKLAEAKAAASADGGISGLLGLEEAATDIQAKMIPALKAMVVELKELADASPDDADLAKKAAAAGKAVATLNKETIKAANAFGSVWDDVWKNFEKTAHDAWMKVGTDGESIFKKIGKVLKTSIMEMLYQLTVKRWIINIGASISESVSGQMAANAATALSGGTTTGLASFGAAGNWLSIGKSIYDGFAGGVSSSLGGLISGVGSSMGFTGAASSTVSSFGAGMASSMTTQEVAEAAAMAIKLTAGTAAAESGAAAAGGLSAGASASSAIPIIGWIIAGMSAAKGLYAQGWDTHNGTVSGTGQVLGSGIMALDSFHRALGMSNTAANILSGQSTIAKLFGRQNPTLESAGIRGVVGESAVGGEAYQNILEKGGWFRSDKRTALSQDIPADIKNTLVATFTELKTAAENYAKQLGVSAAPLQGYTSKFDVRLTNNAEAQARASNKTPEEVAAAAAEDLSKNQAAVTAMFTTIGDEMSAKLIPNIADFAKQGEAASATLQRLSGNFKSTDTIAQLLGKTGKEAFGNAGIASIKAREDFINLSGGLDALSQTMTSYATNYLTQAEQLAPVSKQMDDALGTLGLTSIPKTRDEFKALVSGLDLTDSSQVKTFNSLMQLQDGFAQLHPAIAATGAAAMTMVEILDQGKTLQDQYDEATMTSQQLKDKERLTINSANVALYDSLQIKLAEKKATEDHNTVLGLQAQMYGTLKDEAGAARVLEEQHTIALKDMSPALQAASKDLWAVEKAEKARNAELAHTASMLDYMGQYAEATGDKLLAAQVAQVQFNQSIQDLAPDLQVMATKANDAKLATKAANEETAKNNSILGYQAQLYAATGEKALAAAVAQKQFEASVADLPDNIRAWANAAHEAEAKQTAANTRMENHNTLLGFQARLYAATNDKVMAAKVAHEQFEISIKDLTPVLKTAARAANDAEIALKAKNEKDAETSTLLGLQMDQYVASNSLIGQAIVLEKQRTFQLEHSTQAVQDQLKITWAAQDYAKELAKQQQETNGILDAQAQMYTALNDKANLAYVTEQQHKIALMEMTPALANATRKMWDVQAAAAAAAEALADQNSILDLQSQLYAATGNTAAAAATLQKQHTAALKLLNPAVAAATQILWNATELLTKLKDKASADFAVLNKAITTGKDAAKTAYDAQVKVLNDQKTAAKNSLDLQVKSSEDAITVKDDENKKLTTLASALKSTLDGMSVQAEAVADRIAGQAKIAAALTTFKTTGVAPDSEALAGALKAVAAPSEDMFKSYSDYLYDFQVTKNNLTELNDLTKGAVDTSDKNLKVAKDQLEELKKQTTASDDGFQKQLDELQKAYDLEVKGYDDQIKAAQDQLDVMNGTFVEVRSIKDALVAYNISVLAAIGAVSAAKTGTPIVTGGGSTGLPVTSTPTVIPSTGGTSTPVTPTTPAVTTPAGTNGATWIFGAAASSTNTAAALAILQAGGSSKAANREAAGIAGITAGELGAAQYLFFNPDGSHASGLWSVPRDNYRANLHAGEAVLPAHAAQAFRDYSSGSSNRAMEALMERVLGEISRFREEAAAGTYAMAKSLKNIEDIEDSWDKAGLPHERTEV
jgi:TP901 family phage tail tape measure protein